jgi:hypothetical protein
MACATVEVQVEDLLVTVDGDTPVNIRPYEVSKEIQSLKLTKTRAYDSFEINVSGILQNDLLEI